MCFLLKRTPCFFRMKRQCPEWIHQLVSFKLENGGEFSETDLCKSNTNPSKKDTMLNSKTHTSPNCHSPQSRLKVKPCQVRFVNEVQFQALEDSGVSVQAGIFVFCHPTFVDFYQHHSGLEPQIWRIFQLKNGELLSLALDSPSFFPWCSRDPNVWWPLAEVMCGILERKTSFSEILPRWRDLDRFQLRKSWIHLISSRFPKLFQKKYLE